MPRPIEYWWKSNEDAKSQWRWFRLGISHAELFPRRDRWYSPIERYQKPDHQGKGMLFVRYLALEQCVWWLSWDCMGPWWRRCDSFPLLTASFWEMSRIDWFHELAPSSLPEEMEYSPSWRYILTWIITDLARIQPRTNVVLNTTSKANQKIHGWERHRFRVAIEDKV